MMVGRKVVLTVHKDPKQSSGAYIFSANNLKVKDDRGVMALNGLSLAVRPGEIAAVAGVDGNGQTELAEAIMGLRPVAEGTISLNDKDLQNFNDQAAY